ncbi:MAG TPA: lytic transglycosylase, partial [Clostridiales bacterium UBA8153]|nr:lytic transglycosylase [Clostridiales bacterium UBA8153]
AVDDIPFLETRNYVRRVLRAYRLYRLLYRWDPARGF